MRRDNACFAKYDRSVHTSQHDGMTVQRFAVSHLVLREQHNIDACSQRSAECTETLYAAADNQ